MNLSGILVVSAPGRYDECLAAVAALPAVEVFHRDPSAHRFIVVQEAASVDDEMAGLLHKFEYGRKDQKQGRRPSHAVPIDGDLTSGTATLKSAIVLYAKFCRASPKGDPAPTP